MIVTITQFARLAVDGNGNAMPIGADRLAACEARTTAGSFAALDSNTKFVRLCTDTAIHMDITGGATTSADELFMPGESFISTKGGETLSFIAA